MSWILVLSAVIASLLQPGFSQSARYECTLEKINGEEFCVFRGVQYQSAVGASFGHPTGSAKPARVAFRESTMEHVPREFLQQFSADLKVLNVEDCQLKSVTVTNGLEALYAKDNSIERVVVHQNGPSSVLRELDLSGNQIKDIRNITRCQNLVILNLNGNTGILKNNGNGLILELSDFAGLNKLQELYLSRLNVDYLDNTRKISLESLLLLDLSHNNLIPDDLDLGIFETFEKLQTLRLNDNHMGSIDYNLLLNLKSLKTVYLNGNDFKCEKIKTMLDHLNRNNLETPTETANYDCKSQQNKFLDMCCTGVTPASPRPPAPAPPPSGPTSAPVPPKPTAPPSGTTERTGTGTVTEKTVEPPGGGSMLWIIVGVVVAALVVIAGGVAFFLHKKKQSASRDMQGENTLPLRNN